MKASPVCPDKVLPLLSTMVPDTNMGTSWYLQEQHNSIRTLFNEKQDSLLFFENKLNSIKCSLGVGGVKNSFNLGKENQDMVK